MYVKEDKVINTISTIEKVEIKCTLSNGETLLCEIPETRDGYIQITADELYSNYIPLNRYRYKYNEYINYKLTMQLPLYYSSDDKLLLKIRKINNGRKNYNNNK